MSPDRAAATTPSSPHRRSSYGLATALLLSALVAGGLLALGDRVDLVAQALLLLLPTVAAALLGGLGPATLSALVASALLTYLFTPPERTWEVAGPTNVVALLVQLAVGLSTAAAVDLAARRARQVEESETRRLALARVDRTRTALLAAVGHDLRTPLAAAKASVATLRSPDLDLGPTDTDELLEAADESLDRLAALVANLLDMSRLQAGAMAVALQPVGPGEVAARAVDDLGAPEVVLEGPADLPDVEADAGLLERVLVNLLANARRHSPADRPPRITGTERGAHVELRVVDHGPGIAAEDRDRVFAPFQRLGDADPTTGVGLGLALSRGLAEAMGGTLEATDTPGGGLTMVLRLRAVPAADAQRPLAPGRREREEPDR